MVYTQVSLCRYGLQTSTFAQVWFTDKYLGAVWFTDKYLCAGMVYRQVPLHRYGLQTSTLVQYGLQTSTFVQYSLQTSTFVQVWLHVQAVKREWNVGVDLGGKEFMTEPLQVDTQHLNKAQTNMLWTVRLHYLVQKKWQSLWQLLLNSVMFVIEAFCVCASLFSPPYYLHVQAYLKTLRFFFFHLFS